METCNSILLSIAIPTYNRANYLEENLEAMLFQLESCKDIVEILVNDNASPDNTEQVVFNLIEKYHFPIKYHRMKENVGYKINFSDVTSRVKGKYLFLMGDDDILSPDFFKIIIPHLESKDNLAVIHFNRLAGNANCSMNKLHDWEFDGLTKIMDYKDFWLRVMSSPNFMSSVIVRRDCFEKGISSIKDKYYGYQWFSQICFGSIGEKCLYYYMPLVLMRNPSRTWANEAALYFLVGMSNIFKDMEKYVPGITKKWQERIRYSHFYDFHRTIAGVTSDRKFYRQHKGELMEVMIKSYEKVSMYLMLYISPVFFFRKFYLLLLCMYRKLTNRYIYLRKVFY